MDCQKRRTIAYLAYRMRNEHPDYRVFDHQTESAFSMNADIGEKDFDGHDGEMRHYFTGSIDENELTIYDYDRDEFVNLSLNGDSFAGFDFETETFYEGKINNNRLSIWDLRKQELFRYSICQEPLKSVSALNGKKKWVPDREI